MYKHSEQRSLQIVATVVSTRGLGYVVDIISDGEWFNGAYYLKGGMCDMVADTGTRDIEDTLDAIEQRLGVAK